MSENEIPRVIIIGGGPVGLLLGCLLRDQNVQVAIIEKRLENTRTRRVKLSGQVLLSNMIADGIYLFSEQQVQEKEKAMDSMKRDLYCKVTSLLELYTPIQTIQQVLKDYYTEAGSGRIFVGDQYNVSQNLDSLQRYPNTLIVDCTGYHSLLRDHIQPENHIDRIIELVLICTFLLDDRYECNELCKFYKNRNTKKYRIIPSIDDTYLADDRRKTNVTCLITIDENLFRQLSQIRFLTYEYLQQHQPEIYDDLNTFLDNLTIGRRNKTDFNTMEFVALPLNICRAKKLTRSLNENNLNQHWVLMGDAAMSGPYFQSISMGFDAAIYFAYLFTLHRNNPQEMLNKYEEYVERLWLKLQIHTKEIQRNKQILQSMCLDDRDGILKMLRIY